MKRITTTPADEAERLRLLVESITDYAIYLLDPNGVITSWNRGAERFKDYRPEEIIGENFSRFYGEKDREAGLPARALSIAARDGKFEGEGWRIRRDGSRFWAHVVIDAIYADDGSVIGYAKITRDFTERRKSEDALRRSEEQFRLLVQSVTDYAIYMLSPEGIVTNWNPGAERIKGYKAGEIVGKHFSEFYTDEDRASGEPQRALDCALREGRWEKEGWRVRKDGSRFWCHVIIDPIRDEHGEVLGFAKITRDITERKEAEEMLARAREALFQSQKMDAIGQLTGGVAHDFNNLLMAVLGSLELLRRRLPDDPRMLRLLDNAMAGAQRGAALTQRMLAFARRQKLDTKPVDLSALVRGMTDLLQRSIGPDVAIETQFPLSLEKAMADENQVELALLNLAVNARDAMREGGVILISARNQTVGEGHETGLPAGHYVALSVIDEGEGMDAETVARATEPFFTTKGVGKGTGLGLSMVHGMSEQMGGRLMLRSQMGGGTTAEIWLPAAASGAADTGTEATGLPQGEVSRSLRVLAVDDDYLVLFNTIAMLEELGHTAFSANSAGAALDVLRKEPIDLIVTDHAMPKMTGLQLLEAVRAEWPDLPVILATGYAELPGSTSGEVSVLHKPFTEKDLAAALRSVLEPVA